MRYRQDMELKGNSQTAEPAAGLESSASAGVDSVSFDARLQNALEQAPRTAVPASFAARVTAALPAQLPARPKRSFAHAAALVSIAILAIAMFLLAPHSSPTFSSMAFDFELLLLLQLAGIGYWLTLQTNSRS